LPPAYDSTFFNCLVNSSSWARPPLVFEETGFYLKVLIPPGSLLVFPKASPPPPVREFSKSPVSTVSYCGLQNWCPKFCVSNSPTTDPPPPSRLFSSRPPHLQTAVEHHCTCQSSSQLPFPFILSSFHTLFGFIFSPTRFGVKFFPGTKRPCCPGCSPLLALVWFTNPGAQGKSSQPSTIQLLTPSKFVLPLPFFIAHPL